MFVEECIFGPLEMNDYGDGPHSNLTKLYRNENGTLVETYDAGGGFRWCVHVDG